MEWRKALAETFLAEVQSFGEDVLFRGVTISASVGQSEANKSLEMSGYYEEQSLNLVLPLTEYSGLDSDPRVNETIIIQEQGFRIDSVEKREDAIELNVEKIAGFRYVDPTPTPPSSNQQPLPPSNLQVELGTIPQEPSNLLVFRNPQEPSNLVIDRSPIAPRNLVLEITPLAPSNIVLEITPLEPSNLVIDRSPLAPSNLVIDRSPVAPSTLIINQSPIAPSGITIDRSPNTPSGITIDRSPVAPSTLIINTNPIAPSGITIDRSPTEPSNLDTKVFFDPSQAQPEGWWDASDSSTLTISSGVVTQATDKSGNGYTLSVPLVSGATGASIGNRTLNGLNVFEFTGSNNNVLENNSFTWNQVTNAIGFAMVYRLDDDGLTDQDFIMSGSNSSSRISIRRQLDGSWQLLVSGGSIQTTSKRGIEPVTQMMVAKFNTSNSFIRIDGNQEASGTIGNTNFSAVNISGNYLNQQGIEGYVAEIIFFSDLTKTEEIEGYLSHKWGRTADLPATHPYKTTAP